MSNTFFDFQLFKLSDTPVEAKSSGGQYQKRLLIFFEAPEAEVTALTDFLAKILKAIHLDLNEDTLFINRKPNELFSITALLEEKEPKQVLIFGMAPTDLGIRFSLPPYHNVSHQDTAFLWADALTAIFAERQAHGKEMSGKLWKAIQQFEL